MRIVNIAVAMAMSAAAVIACGQGMPASSLSKSPGTAPTRAGPQFYRLPAGAYVMAYGGQQVDAAVSAQGQSITVSFAGLTYSGSIAANTNHFASTQLVMGHPAIDGNLTADGVMSGRYLTTDPRGAPRPPADFTLTMKGAGPTISSSSGQKGIPAGSAAQQTLNAPASPPPPSAVMKPGDANSLNPQPLPPKPEPNWGNRPGERSSLNPQPLPPEPSWGTKQNAPSPRSSSDEIKNTGVAGPASMRPVHVGEIAAKRFRAMGLDPASPNFAAQVRARLQSATARAMSDEAADRQRQPSTDARALASKAQTITVHRIAPVSKPSQALEITDVVWVTGDTFAQQASGPHVLRLPSILGIVYKDAMYSLEARPATVGMTVRIVIPDCGIDYTHTVHADDVSGYSGAGPGGLPAVPKDQHIVLAPINRHLGGDYWPVLYQPMQYTAGKQWGGLGDGVRAGQIILTHSGSTAEMDVGFEATFTPAARTFVVAPEPPFRDTSPAAADGSDWSLPLDDSQVSFASPDVSRVNFSDQPIEGEDVLATGVALGAGWHLGGVRIRRVWSLSDAHPGFEVNDNTSRGATVVAQPPEGQVYVTIKWHVGPGDSIGYVAEWDLVGPQGQRAVTTLPKIGPCDQ